MTSPAGGAGTARAARTIAAAACAVALLAGCGPSGEDGTTPVSSAPSDSASADAGGSGIAGVSVAGSLAHPIVVIDTPLEVGETEIAVAEAGTGRPLTAGGPALLAVAGWDGNTGVSSSGGEELVPRLVDVTAEAVGETLAEYLPGVREGSRVVMAEPVDVEGAMTMQVVVVDVLPTEATEGSRPGGESPSESPSGGSSGSEDEMPVSGMPSIGTGSGGAPVVGIPSGDPPGSLVQRVVIAGGGSSVVPGQTIVMQYLAMNWETGDVVASTWADGRPSEIAVDDLAEGVRLAVLDRPVGSRVLAVVPPGLADGEHTLVVVVDILAATGGDDPVR